jgi:hypothetical protein
VTNDLTEFVENYIESRKVFSPVRFQVLNAADMKWLSSSLLRRAVWQMFTDVSKVLAASIIRAMCKPHATNRFER